VIRHYILDGHCAVPVDLMTWARWYEDAKDLRIVARTTIAHVDVSTVFLGTDQRIDGEGPPLIFETMIFGGPEDGYTARASTWEEAEKSHLDACALVEAGLV
jgi:hypothetical protein